MNPIFESNQQILITRYPHVKSLSSETGSTVLQTPSGANFEMNFTGSPAKTPLVFLKGIQSIDCLKTAMSFFNRDDAEFVVVEPNVARMNALLNDENAKSLLSHPRVHWWMQRTTDEFFADAYDYLRTPSRLFHMQAALFVTAAQLTTDELSYFETIEDEWVACQRQRIRSLGGVEDSRIGFKNVVDNRATIESHQGIRPLKGEFKDLPAVVISTGPSLKKSLPALKALQNRAVLIAADASLKILRDAEIEPHFVCSMERDEEPKVFFEQLGEQKSYLVAYPLVPQGVLNAYKGPLAIAYRDYGYFHIMEHELARGILPSSSSVAHMCLRLALYLECKSVALVGQDLAYDPETLQSHSHGVAQSEWAQARSRDEIEKRASEQNLGDVFDVPGNFGAPVPTNSVYFSFMKEFSWEALQTKTPVINCTEGGAVIPNILWRPIKEWAADFKPEVSIFARIQGLCAKSAKGPLTFKLIKDFLNEMVPKLGQVVEILAAVKGQVFVQKAMEQTLVSIRKSEQQLLGDYRYVTIVVQNAGREYLDLVNEIEVLEVQSKTASPEYFEKISALYELISKVSRQLLGCFES